MLRKTVFLSALLALLRVGLLHATPSILGVTLFSHANVVSPSSFSQLFTVFFFISGILFNNTFLQYREAEKFIDEAVCDIYELLDGISLTYGDVSKPGAAKTALQHVISYVECWIRELSEPPVKSFSPTTSSSLLALRRLAEVSRSLSSQQGATSTEVIEKPASVAGSLLRFGNQCRRNSIRIWTIRRTCVLHPAQRFVGAMVALMLICIFVTDWPFHPIADFVCVTTANCGVLLVFRLIQALDDPFDVETDLTFPQLLLRTLRLDPRSLTSGGWCWWPQLEWSANFSAGLVLRCRAVSGGHRGAIAKSPTAQSQTRWYIVRFHNRFECICSKNREKDLIG